MMMNRALLAIDLFSGCGGLTLGLKQAGFKVIGAVEVDPLSVETYKTNHPEVEIWETDIKALKVSEVKRNLRLRKGQLDLLAGCPPCQGFSKIRTLNGKNTIKDPRNDLIFEFLRFVKGLKPKAIMMENVPGITQDARLALFCSQLEDIGYKVDFKVLNAADYGVPQRRRRMILLASKHEKIEFAEPCVATRTVKEAIGQLPPPGQSGDPIHDYPEKRSSRVMELIRKIPKDGGSRTDLGEKHQLECHRKCDGFKDVYGRMAWDDVAPTITSGCTNPSKGRFIHPVENRAITMREAALLQGFPKSYIFPSVKNKSAVASMIGNAFPPPFIATHANMIIRQINNAIGKSRRFKQPSIST